MFSKLLIKLVAYRISAMKICGGAIISWDYKRQRATKSHNFLYWTWLIHTSSGFIYSVMMAVHLSSKMYGIDEDKEMDEESDPVKEQEIAFKEIASTIIGWGEAALTTAIGFVGVVITKNRDELIYLFNQFLLYNEERLKMLMSESEHQQLPPRHKDMLRKNDVILITMLVLSITVTLPLGVVFAHPFEPTHRMMREWFELDVRVTLEYLPVFVFCGILLIAASNGSIILCVVVGMYFSVAKIGLEDIETMSVSAEGDNRFVTKGYGILSDQQIIILYRIQQAYNVLLNNILASLMVAFHQLAILAVVVVLSYFTIKFNYILEDAGIIGYAAVFGCLSASLFLLICQATMFGIIADSSTNFKESGEKLVQTVGGRRSLFRKFLKSCSTFTVQEAYPFYTIHRSTFLMFCQEAIGQTVNLLLA